MKQTINLPEKYIIDALNSIEYIIFDGMSKVGTAYMKLCNPSSQKEAFEMLAMLTLCSRDLEKIIRGLLNDVNCPLHLVRNVGAKTKDTLDSKFLNAQHFFQRFLHCEPQHKVQNLTALYYLIKDLSEIVPETKVSDYYKSYEV